MNKSELIKAFAEKFDIGDAAASDMVGLFFAAIKESLARGDRVEIRGFGAFVMREYKGYAGRNPKSGEIVIVQPKRLPFFSLGKGFREEMNRDE